MLQLTQSNAGLYQVRGTSSKGRRSSTVSGQPDPKRSTTGEIVSIAAIRPAIYLILVRKVKAVMVAVRSLIGGKIKLGKSRGKHGGEANLHAWLVCGQCLGLTVEDRQVPKSDYNVLDDDMGLICEVMSLNGPSMELGSEDRYSAP